MIFWFSEIVSMDKKHFCVSDQKFAPSFFKVYPNRFYISSFLHTFLRKIPWKLYDPFITFKLEIWRMYYLHFSKSYSVCLWNFFENITGMPLRGHLLAARVFISSKLAEMKAFEVLWKFARKSRFLARFRKYGRPTFKKMHRQTKAVLV